MSLASLVDRKLFLLYCSAAIEFYTLQHKAPEMPVLEPTGRIHALRGVAETERPNALQIPRPTPNSPSMDHLDALEAQSIYVFREAFARLKKLALLWSLGKDSNVMIWLARKA